MSVTSQNATVAFETDRSENDIQQVLEEDYEAGFIDTDVLSLNNNNSESSCNNSCTC